ncbi:MAG: hypothetical protein KBT34_05440 [Prevotella sp.]|nr:hypothetical protein [Candidatus Prevotella equi]
MIYAPHTLHVKRTEIKRDEYNRPVSSEDIWKEVCKCRCDDNNTQHFQTEEGRVYRPQYHIVCPRNIDVRPGEMIKVTNGDVLRGEGKVYNVKVLNFLDYAEIWV